MKRGSRRLTVSPAADPPSIPLQKPDIPQQQEQIGG